MHLSAATQRSLSRGRALYNSGQHWDAHEAWEDAWQEEEGDVKLLLQGLIQVAAAMHKAMVQLQPSSCVKLLGSALAKLDPLPEDAGGLELGAFREQARRAQEHAEAWSRGAVTLFDRRFIPVLELLGERSAR